MVSETIEITSEDIFGLIVLSGDAKASYHHAMLLMQEGKAEEAAEAVKAADATLKEAHAIQTKFVTLEAQGKTATVGVLMVLMSVMWWCGIHGTAILRGIMGPLLTANAL